VCLFVPGKLSRNAAVKDCEVETTFIGGCDFCLDIRINKVTADVDNFRTAVIKRIEAEGIVTSWFTDTVSNLGYTSPEFKHVDCLRKFKG